MATFPHSSLLLLTGIICLLAMFLFLPVDLGPDDEDENL
jgi:hypothetical protein